MSKPRAIPLAAQVEAAVERAEKAEGQVTALDYGIKAAHAQCATLKAELTALNRAQRAAKARIKELEMKGVHDFEPPKTAPPPPGDPCRQTTVAYVMELYASVKCALAEAKETEKKLRAELARAQADAAFEKALRYSAQSRADWADSQLREARQKALSATSAPGKVVEVPSQTRFFTMGETFCLFTGLGLGVIAGGMLL